MTNAYQTAPKPKRLTDEVKRALSVDDAAAVAADREWFAAHPTETHRLRPPFSGEETALLTPIGWHTVAIHVWQLGPGVRIRHAVIAPSVALPFFLH